MKPKLLVAVGVALMWGRAWAADAPAAGAGGRPLPPLETFMVAPIDLTYVSCWVPADKTGPEINRSCRQRAGCRYACTLPAAVSHTKTATCLQALARLLAEYAWPLHQDALPLTISNGWQWEHYYSLSQFAEAQYDLPQRGGSWEECLEAVLRRSSGSIRGQWRRMGATGKLSDAPVPETGQSNIAVETFSNIRARHGYPKERVLR